MYNATPENRKLPFNCRVLCFSLGGATLLLTLVFSLHYLGYISIEAAIWAAVGVFVAAAAYESFLMSLIARHMLSSVNRNSAASNLNSSADSPPVTERLD